MGRNVADWRCRIEPPPSTNNLYSGRRFKTPQYEAWITAIGLQINLARGPKQRPIERCEVEIRIPYNGRRDPDNFLKPVLDQLVRMRIIATDNMTCVRRIVIEVDDDAVLCDVRVTEI